MAIRLKVQETKVKLNITDGDSAKFKVAEGIPIYPNAYTGAYEVTPTRETQTLATENLMMTDNVIVNPIPPQYGLITYNGSIITVS